jgi:drug/metabolite transporter (DMT)-like permease
MTLNNKTITRGFILAGFMNLSVLIFSLLFTNEAIPEFDPQVMSTFGLVMICIWGIAYIAVAKNYQHVKWLVGVFVFEKLIYGVVWIEWILNNDISKVFERDLLAGMFYSVYGLNDLLFCAFFLSVFIKIMKLKDN